MADEKVNDLTRGRVNIWEMKERKREGGGGRGGGGDTKPKNFKNK